MLAITPSSRLNLRPAQTLSVPYLILHFQILPRCFLVACSSNFLSFLKFQISTSNLFFRLFLNIQICSFKSSMLCANYSVLYLCSPPPLKHLWCHSLRYQALIDLGCLSHKVSRQIIASFLSPGARHHGGSSCSKGYYTELHRLESLSFRTLLSTGTCFE